jgi:hypothetical protein
MTIVPTKSAGWRPIKSSTDLKLSAGFGSQLARAWVYTLLAVQFVGVPAGLLCIGLSQYQPGILLPPTMEVFWLIAGFQMLGLVITFIPALVFSLILAVIIRHGIKQHWPRWTSYLAALSLMTLFFFGLASLTSHSIPDLATHFRPVDPVVRRPALSVSEIPLFASCLVASLLGAWVCVRVLRPAINRSPSQ